jgi:hypothetical protein
MQAFYKKESIMKMDDILKLEKVIESLRKEMIRIGIQEGLTTKRTIAISQKLDKYIAIYQAVN